MKQYFTYSLAILITIAVTACVEDPPEEEWHVPDNPIDTTQNPIDTITDPSIFFSDTAKEIPLGTVINIGSPELLYSDSEIPIRYDGSLNTIKKSVDSMYFYHSYGCRINPGAAVPSRHTCFAGNGINPLSELVFEKTEEALWDYQGYYQDTDQEGIWILGMHKLSNGDILGITHSEVNYPGSDPDDGFDYSIGIGYSTDNGQTWLYCGEIILPKVRIPHINTGGGPYLMVDDYMYVYYNDNSPDARGIERKSICVARANFSEVVDAAKEGNVTTWKKYRDGTWEVDGLDETTGGSAVIPVVVGGEDCHSDAAYCASLQKYLMTVQTAPAQDLALYSSEDGVNWTKEQVIDVSTDNVLMPYSAFVDYDGPSDDCSIVDNNFYIYYPHKSKDNHDVDDMYRVQVTID